MPPLISIVSGTYNRLNPYLIDMIASVRVNIPTGVDYEIVLVDGGSNDGTIEWCKTQPDIRLIEHGALLGAIRAFTEGAYAARGKFVLLANDDIIFTPHSIMRALVYLEDNPLVGAAAMPDDRPVQWKTPGQFGCQYMPANRNGVHSSAIYAQVGLYRKWLGDKVNWWGYGQIDAMVYGGDNFLSARILEMGYKVDCVEGANVIDRIPRDELRVLNETHADKGYHLLYPNGVNITEFPRMDNPDERQLRVLYMPVFERGHTVQRQQKRGLREALKRHFMVWEIDYVNTDNLNALVKEVCEVFKPHLVLTQFNGASIDTARLIRETLPRAVMVNWNGDVWPHGLTAPDVLQMLRLYDLQLVVNDRVLDIYRQHNIPAAYWQIGFEEPSQDELPDVPEHDIVFLANCYSDERKKLGEFLKTLPYNVGLYGTGWGELGSGECLYNFAMSRALYRNAKLAIGDNQYPSERGFVSNRVFEALSAGGALLLHQTVNGLDELTGLRTLTHYDWWDTFETLKERIEYYFAGETGEDIRSRMVKLAHDFVRANHSFNARVIELIDLIDKYARREMSGHVLLENPTAKISGGVIGVTGQSYQFTPGQTIEVHPDDADYLVNQRGFKRVK